jgi:hypothetical protein|tara:strand:- start:214 stop:570 length:357 start_codon:yes stop_codon:yes gene_type:complete
MARRQIRFDQIGKHMEGEVLKLVAATTLEWEARVKKATPRGQTSRLVNGWQSKIDRFQGEILNNIEYAEPVIYGTALPPSWGGKFRTRQGTIKGYPDIIGKELESWAQRQYKKIVRDS